MSKNNTSDDELIEEIMNAKTGITDIFLFLLIFNILIVIITDIY